MLTQGRYRSAAAHYQEKLLQYVIDSISQEAITDYLDQNLAQILETAAEPEHGLLGRLLDHKALSFYWAQLLDSRSDKLYEIGIPHLLKPRRDSSNYDLIRGYFFVEQAASTTNKERKSQFYQYALEAENFKVLTMEIQFNLEKLGTLYQTNEPSDNIRAHIFQMCAMAAPLSKHGTPGYLELALVYLRLFHFYFTVERNDTAAKAISVETLKALLYAKKALPYSESEIFNAYHTSECIITLDDKDATSYTIQEAIDVLSRLFKKKHCLTDYDIRSCMGQVDSDYASPCRTTVSLM